MTPASSSVARPAAAPSFLEAGSGPGIVCIHGNGSLGAQWRGLMELLAPRFRVLAPDSYDCGKSPRWPSDRVIRLRDEVELVEPVLQRAGSPLALVGHSYGAAVALIAALANPGRVAAMALYEPTLFSLIDAGKPRPNDADGIRDTVADAAVALDHKRMAQRVAQGQNPQAAHGVGEQGMGAVETGDKAQVARQLCPARGLHRAAHLEGQLVEQAVYGCAAQFFRQPVFMPEPQQVAIGGDVIEPVVVHSNVGHVRGHLAEGAGPAQFQEAFVAGGIELQKG